MNEITKIDPMRIVIYAPGMPFDAATIATRSLGGSESAAFYLARELASRRHHVVVFTTQDKPVSGAGVTYLNIGEQSQATPLGAQFELYACNTPHDLLIAQRLPHVFHRQFAAKVCIWQLHDLALFRTAPMMMGGTWQIDAATVVSEWHAEQVRKVWNMNPAILRVVPNGVDQGLYAVAPTDPALHVTRSVNEEEWGMARYDQDAALIPSVTAPTGRFLLLYQSRPERGLSYALDCMEKAALIGLPIHLLVCAYDNPVAHMEQMYSAVYARANSMQNVTLLGALSKPELAVLQQQSDLLFYPTEFEEVSCITAMEAMHAGLPMLTSAVGALPETCEGSGTELVPLKDGHVDLNAFDARLQAHFGLVKEGEYPEVLNKLKTLQLDAANLHTWARATDRLLEVHAEALAKKQRPAAILRHAVEHSDIVFADWYIKQLDAKARVGFDYSTNDPHTFKVPGPVVHDDPIVETTRREIERLYSFAHDPDDYARHYAQHQGRYYDEFEDKVVGEDVTQSTRYRGVLGLIAEHINKVKAQHLRVLDYGCAHGHYSIPLAKTFLTCDFVGLDISNRAVLAARHWAERDGVQNVEFHVGNQVTLRTVRGEDDTLGLFDVIVAGEVLEHVWDYLALLNDLRGRLAPGGVLILTTPLGRWEHSGTVPFRSAREHMHHFDRGDIEDIAHGHAFQVLHAPAGHDRSGFGLSSYVWAVWPKDGLPLWSVDYDRKLRQYAPRQSVTACIIAKNAEATLRRCVESFIDWVDEVVVCIDAGSSDGTARVCTSLQESFPNRPIIVRAGVDALKDGFSAARNRSIDVAHGDWIMWIDADEELRSPYQMHRFLRPSMHNGYGWPQVHYSVEPQEVLTTDYPCRLFRNHIGVKFYGFVHEHPEQGIGNAIPWSLVRQEMKFLHHGYYDEETRQARFRRNYPLLLRDVKEHPVERPLNKFLHLRDIAQSIQFDARARGAFTGEHAREAWHGIRVMEEIARMPQIKMIADSMQYYSLCVASLGIGFDAELTMKTKHPQAPDLAASLNFNGRFHSHEFFQALVLKFTQESIKHYDDPHL